MTNLLEVGGGAQAQSGAGQFTTSAGRTGTGVGSSYSWGGGGGSQTSGGLGAGTYVPGGNGSLGLGGSGSTGNSSGSGGGGGGYYGGAAGGNDTQHNNGYSANGGGGSSYIGGVTSDTASNTNANTVAGHASMPNPQYSLYGSKNPTTQATINPTQVGQTGSGYAVITQLTTPPSVTTATATINNDGADSTRATGKLNWTTLTPSETIRYSYTVSNTDSQYAFTGISGNKVTDPNGFICGPWNQASQTAGFNGGQAIFTIDCTPDKTYFTSVTAKTNPAPSLTATFTGTFNGTSTTTDPVAASGVTTEFIYTNATVSETNTMGTPDNGAAGQVGLGDQIKYTYTINNTNSTTAINNISLSSTVLDRHPEKVVNCPPTIAAGATGTCTVTFNANSTDVANSTLTNSTVIKADTTYLGNENTTGSTIGTTATQSLNVEVTKLTVNAPTLQIVTDVAPDGLSSGDTVRWSTIASNTGTVQLVNVNIKDQDNRVYGTANYTLAANGNTGTIYTPNYVFSYNDAKSTPYAETATATGQVASCSISTCATVNASATTNSALTVYNSANTSTAAGTIPTDKYSAGKVDLNDTFLVTANIKNSGNIAWNSLTVKDDLNNAYTCNVVPGVGATATCTYSTTATKALIGTGTITRKVSYTYVTAAGETVNGTITPDVTFTSVVPVKGMLLTISSNPTNANPIVKGTNVAFTYTIKNTGNIDLKNPRVSTTDGITCTTPAGTVVAPGASTTCTASKVIG